MENRFFIPPKDTTKLDENDCIILLFGEKHDDDSTIKLISSMSEYLRKNLDGQITYALEHANSDSREKTAQAHIDSYESKLIEIKEKIVQEIADRNAIIDECKNLLEINNNQDPNLTDELNTIIHSYEKEVAQLRSQATNMLNEASVEYKKGTFISNLDRSNIGYASIDLTDEELGLHPQMSNEECLNILTSEDSAQEREKYMTGKIISLMSTNKVVMVHVGAAHTNALIDGLINKGVNPDKIIAYRVGNEQSFASTIQRTKERIKQLSEKGLAAGTSDRDIYRYSPLGASTNIIPVIMPNDANEDMYAKKAKELADNVFSPNEHPKATKST